MALKYGTIVTPYDSDIDTKTCNQGVCVGIITELHEPDGGAKTDAEVDISVKWLDLCMMHAMRYSDYIPTHTTTKINNLWEIGQTR